jgi:hypothetical protein
MAMKKIKPQYGKVVPPVMPAEVTTEEQEISQNNEIVEEKSVESIEKAEKTKKPEKTSTKKSASKITNTPNPFMQTKEVFAKANLTKIGYRMRTEYVEVLDIIKKMKKGGYTLEAVLDDALTHYFENSEDGREALKKAEIFYS